MSKNICDDIRIMIIKENGDIDTIFSADDGSIKNVINLKNEKDINHLYSKYNEIKNDVNNDDKDKHLFYLKQYLENNFTNEFNERKYNRNTNDDLMLYYYLTTIGNILIINSTEHLNILTIPNNGISQEQQQKLNDVKCLFDNSFSWSLVDNMHIAVEEIKGVKYGFLDVGERIHGNIDEVICAYLEKQPKKR